VSALCFVQLDTSPRSFDWPTIERDASLYLPTELSRRRVDVVLATKVARVQVVLRAALAQWLDVIHLGSQHPNSTRQAVHAEGLRSQSSQSVCCGGAAARARNVHGCHTQPNRGFMSVTVLPALIDHLLGCPAGWDR
jgi:hypothetical protein